MKTFDRLRKIDPRNHKSELASLALALSLGMTGGCSTDTDASAKEPAPVATADVSADSVPGTTVEIDSNSPNIKLAVSSGDPKFDKEVVETIYRLGKLIVENDDDGKPTSSGSNPTDRYEVTGDHDEYAAVTSVANVDGDGELISVEVSTDYAGQHTTAAAGVSPDGLILIYFDGTKTFEVPAGAQPTPEEFSMLFGVGFEQLKAFSTPEGLGSLVRDN